MFVKLQKSTESIQRNVKINININICTQYFNYFPHLLNLKLRICKHKNNESSIITNGEN